MYYSEFNLEILFYNGSDIFQVVIDNTKLQNVPIYEMVLESFASFEIIGVLQEHANLIIIENLYVETSLQILTFWIKCWGIFLIEYLSTAATFR